MAGRPAIPGAEVRGFQGADMDLKVYYEKLRQTEASLPGPDVVIVSLATPDGGRAGVPTETPREIAAKMIVDGTARMASEAEALEYEEKRLALRRSAEEAALASRIQVTLVAESDAKRPSGAVKGIKGK